jgi:hypothetical protein
VLQGEATATVVVVDSDSVVSVVDLEEDLGEVKAAEVDSDSGEETAAAKAREAPADLDSAARVEVVTAKVEAAMDLDLVATVEVVTAKVEAGKAKVEEVVKAKVVAEEKGAGKAEGKVVALEDTMTLHIHIPDQPIVLLRFHYQYLSPKPQAMGTASKRSYSYQPFFRARRDTAICPRGTNTLRLKSAIPSQTLRTNYVQIRIQNQILSNSRLL